MTVVVPALEKVLLQEMCALKRGKGGKKLEQSRKELCSKEATKAVQFFKKIHVYDTQVLFLCCWCYGCIDPILLWKILLFLSLDPYYMVISNYPLNHVLIKPEEKMSDDDQLKLVKWGLFKSGLHWFGRFSIFKVNNPV